MNPTNTYFLSLIVVFLISFFITFLSVLFLRSILRKKKVEQPIYHLAPSTHHIKQNTVTMGGVAIVSSVIISSIILSLYSYFSKTSCILPDFSILSPRIYFIIIVLILSSLIGFYDDLKKVLGKKNRAGTTKKIKFLLQFTLCIFIMSIYSIDSMSFNIHRFESINFSNEIYISLLGNIHYLYYPFAFFLLIGGSNAVNLTDGLDGLVARNLVITFFAFSIISFMSGNTELLVLNLIFSSSLIAFLCFNIYPASIFMGDTGSLALGTIISLMAMLLKIELLFIFFAIIYIVETLSVIIQVAYFKYTNGKRFFKMAPIHHHFEKMNYHENKISFNFALINLICTTIGLYIYWYFY